MDLLQTEKAIQLLQHVAEQKELHPHNVRRAVVNQAEVQAQPLILGRKVHLAPTEDNPCLILISRLSSSPFFIINVP